MGRSTTTKMNETTASSAINQLSTLVDAGSSTDERIIYLNTDISEMSAAMTISQLFAYGKQDPIKPIHLVISTGGGDVYDMFSIYDAMKFVKSPIHTIGLGKIMSAGVLLLAAGTKGKRFIGQNSTVMMHQMWGGTMGNIFEQEVQYREFIRLQQRGEACLSREIGRTTEEVKSIMDKGRDHFMTAEEAIEFGIADGILGKDAKL